MAESEHRKPVAPEDFEGVPLTRNEYITCLVHFYRGERGRAEAWRARLDPTTNWAVVTAGGMLSVTFSDPQHSHVTLLLAIVLVIMFLGFEARRFRTYDVWRARVRMLEENFFIPILRRDLISPRQDWREWVARDLDHPMFKLTYLQAAGLRLRNNYVWILGAILMAWIAKANIHPTPAPDFAAVVDRMAVGPLPGWAVAALVAAFYAGLVFIAVRVGEGVDEICGQEREVGHWKT